MISTTPFGAFTIRGQARNQFKVNGQRLKHYFGGNIDLCHSRVMRNQKNLYS